MVRSHDGFDLAVDGLLLCCGLLLTFSVKSSMIAPLDVGSCSLHFIYLSLRDCVSPIR